MAAERDQAARSTEALDGARFPVVADPHGGRRPFRGRHPIHRGGHLVHEAVPPLAIREELPEAAELLLLFGHGPIAERRRVSDVGFCRQ